MGKLTMDKVLKGQPVAEDFLSQDRFNIKMSEAKRKRLRKRLRKQRAEVYEPNHSFSDFSGE